MKVTNVIEGERKLITFVKQTRSLTKQMRQRPICPCVLGADGYFETVNTEYQRQFWSMRVLLLYVVGSIAEIARTPTKADTRSVPIPSISWDAQRISVISVIPVRLI